MRCSHVPVLLSPTQPPLLIAVLVRRWSEDVYVRLVCKSGIPDLKQYQSIWLHISPETVNSSGADVRLTD